MHRKRKFKRAASGDDYALEKQTRGRGEREIKCVNVPIYLFTMVLSRNIFIFKYAGMIKIIIRRRIEIKNMTSNSTNFYVKKKKETRLKIK